ncbi:dephospho-CoA kinase [Mycetocola manganoxydans]|uniref:Dephospho-CoA kinase n=1 Tax=Mycetocola manganoxydans TaxID=699879 RepID=A0A3L6ZXK4_9MICO|nr:dephospho-CoA kinase [Mycetocola manganoxydans]RLP72490.1 dephospho-CoA kinase [Mycetocola manganoxydans]GHD40046.1 dephospho-CoA kinase [Mycetocola manganoxydans]
MQLIGLTGGIASGKSTIAKRLAELGAVHIDADQLSREVVEPGTPGLEAIAERFGNDVIAEDGSLDRAALGAVIFADRAAREDLNAIVHPAVRELGQKRIAAARDADADAIIVYDVPLLVESRNPYSFDRIVVASASRETRLGRLIDARGMDPDEAARRIDAQATEDERLAIADVVIDTDGTLEHTLAQAYTLWQSLTTERRA